jgi:hypothetical protein
VLLDTKRRRELGMVLDERAMDGLIMVPTHSHQELQARLRFTSSNCVNTIQPSAGRASLYTTLRPHNNDFIADSKNSILVKIQG